MDTKKFTPPFLIQMTSGEFNKQCDILPHGSFHMVKKDQNGHLWLANKIDCVPPDYSIKIVEVKPETKECPSCKNEFPKDWTFMEHTCIRCFERKYIPNREAYRAILRAELKLELNK